ncbi:MAG: integrin alpha, partial [Chloroflexi bacterium]|nr:integrin alpha [Chloroflexota bacterium]
MKTNHVRISLAVLVTVAVLLGAADLQATAGPAGLAKPADRGSAAPPIVGAGATEDWWAAAQAHIEKDLNLSKAMGISTTPDWSVIGQTNNDKFGYSVASAGDVNGDGYADVIVGAYGYQGGADAGKSYAFYGSASGLSTTSNWSSSGEHGGGFGYAVAGAGDVNGDGY